MKVLKIRSSSFVLILLVSFVFFAPFCTAQGELVEQASSNVQIYDPAWEQQGDGYFNQDILRGREQPEQQNEVVIMIKMGKKTYCAWSNQLLHNDVDFRQVPPEEAAKLYDDGTHNDEIPFDGLPSNVEIDNDSKLSPYAIAIRDRMKVLNDRILKTEDIRRYKAAEWDELGKWDALRFYSGFHVASLDRKSDMKKYIEQMQVLTEYSYYFEQNVLGQFEGYEYYPDKEYPGWEDELWSNQDPLDKEVRDYWDWDNRIMLERERDNQAFGGGIPGFPGGGGAGGAF